MRTSVCISWAPNFALWSGQQVVSDQVEFCWEATGATDCAAHFLLNIRTVHPLEAAEDGEQHSQWRN